MRFTDHKTVGLQYGLTALAFLLVGFLLMLLMRWQLAWPGQAVPAWIAWLLGESNAPGGIMLPEFYSQLVAMHGSVMVFLAVVPLAAGATPHPPLSPSTAASSSSPPAAEKAGEAAHLAAPTSRLRCPANVHATRILAATICWRRTQDGAPEVSSGTSAHIALTVRTWRRQQWNGS